MSAEPEIASGLRDAIWNGYKKWSDSDRAAGPEDYIEIEVRAWLAAVSEEEIEAAARAAYECEGGLDWAAISEEDRGWYRTLASTALAASRRVLLPKEES